MFVCLFCLFVCLFACLLVCCVFATIKQTYLTCGNNYDVIISEAQWPVLSVKEKTCGVPKQFSCICIQPISCANNCFLLGFSSPVSCLHTTVDSCTFQLLSQTDAQELLRQICTSPSLIVQPPASRTSPCVQVNSAGKCIRIASQISSRCFVQCSKQILYYI